MNGEKVFVVDAAEYGLSEMLAANRDDAALCEWLAVAGIGDRFPALIECVRIR